MHASQRAFLLPVSAEIRGVPEQQDKVRVGAGVPGEPVKRWPGRRVGRQAERPHSSCWRGAGRRAGRTVVGS